MIYYLFVAQLTLSMQKKSKMSSRKITQLAYYIPVNKLLIECTPEMYIHFRPVSYEHTDDYVLFGRSSLGNSFMPSLCFVVAAKDSSKVNRCFHTYEEAYNCFKLKTNELLHTYK